MTMSFMDRNRCVQEHSQVSFMGHLQRPIWVSIATLFPELEDLGVAALEGFIFGGWWVGGGDWVEEGCTHIRALLLRASSDRCTAERVGHSIPKERKRSRCSWSFSLPSPSPSPFHPFHPLPPLFSRSGPP